MTEPKHIPSPLSAADGLFVVGTLDRQEVYARLLEVAARVTQAHDAVVWSGDSVALRCVATRGSQARDRVHESLAVRGALADQLRGERAVALPDAGKASVLRLPLWASAGQHTLLEVFNRGDGGRFSQTDVRALNDLGVYGRTALRNVADMEGRVARSAKNAATSVYNLQHTLDYGEKEISKARRYGRSFSVVLLKVDVGFAMDEGAVRQTRDAVREVCTQLVRSSDLLGQAGEDEYYLLLSDTDAVGSRLLVQKLARQIEKVLTDARLRAEVAIGAATFPLHASAFQELLVKCSEDVVVFRESTYTRLGLARMSFWDQVRALLGDATDGARSWPEFLPPKGQGMPGTLALVPFSVYEAIQGAALEEVGRTPENRSLYYGVAGTPGRAEHLVQRVLSANAQHVATLLCPGTPDPIVHTVDVQDAQLYQHEVLLVSTPMMAYGLLGVAASDGIRAYHTGEHLVVESLVCMLKEAFALQQRGRL